MIPIVKINEPNELGSKRYIPGSNLSLRFKNTVLDKPVMISSVQNKPKFLKEDYFNDSKDRNL